MYEESQLLRFDPFIFKNGHPSKPKFFLALRHMGETLMMATLPTSKDHLPETLAPQRGCVNDTERQVNAFVFESGDQVTELFSFPRRTYIYSEQIDEYDQNYLDAMATTVTLLGKLTPELMQQLIECLKSNPLLKRKFRKYL